MKPQVIVIDGILYATLTTGNPVQKTLTPEQIDDVKNKMYTDELTDNYLINLCTPGLVKREQLKESLSELVESGLFYEQNGRVYRKGIPLSIPELLVNKFVDVLGTDKFESYDNFWKLCSLNPNAEARQDLFKFIQGGKFTITSSGLVVAYRNVAIKSEGNQSLVDTVTKSYVKVKQWKKNPKSFEIYNVAGDYYLYNTKNQSDPTGEFVGTLDYLYSNIQEFTNTIYTDNYTGTFDIVPGIPVQMDRSKCDGKSNNACSYGLHLGNVSFLKQGQFGQVGLMCLVNPMHVVAVPHYDHNKLRCCEYMPVSVVEYEDGKLVEIDTEIYEDDYCHFTVEQINEMLETENMVEHKINSLFESFDVEVFNEIANQTVLERNIFYNEEDDYYDEEE